MKTRETACPGYQAALAAHRAVAPERRIDGHRRSCEWQTRAVRAISRPAFPEPEVVQGDGAGLD
ncbi:hypothetical protein [Streptomyces sp. CC224B]|uniref:hypothetical protein n=1 Tax=Streptomyces sp. CC224B TaxID=3044571 RepID=UPI0024A7F605|nr:hypothetical protein [Streptomyces sp. CC224B]